MGEEGAGKPPYLAAAPLLARGCPPLIDHDRAPDTTRGFQVRASNRTNLPAPALCVFAVAVVFTGCGPASHGTSAKTPAPKAVESASPRYPLNAYEPTPRDQAERDYVYRRGVRDCMNDNGYSYLPRLTARLVDQEVRTTAEFDSRRYGITDLSIASRYGYQLSPATKGSGKPRSLAGLPAAERKNLSECAQAANDALHIDSGAQADMAVVAQLDQKAFQQTESDPRMTAVFAAWSRCMANAGYSYADPYKAAADHRFEHSSITPSALELAVARADISCKRKTGLVRIASSVESEHQSTLIAHNGATLARVTKELAHQKELLASLMGDQDRS